ncbi:MAG TPA: BamA/TamA family outer membrane protein, partial [Polyangiaceae bacterium]|nr:BamA/TamA family outer membrane protein [Polyangiaceae bacterium]
YGLGPDALESARLRYGEDRLEARGVLETRPTASTLLRSELVLRSVEFRKGGFGPDPLLSDAVKSGMPAPAGYTRGYTLARSELTATYDERKLGRARRAGVFGGARGSLDAETRSRDTFVSYGAKAGGFYDLTQRGRVVSLAVSTAFADPLGGGDIPFTELVGLGGLEPMRGFYAGRLADRSAAVAELAYRWPIWIWLNGAMRAEVGNVFGEHLSGFEAGKLRWSGTIGIESTNPAETGFELLLGVGSETFEQGGKVDSVRFVIGTTHGI